MKATDILEFVKSQGLNPSDVYMEYDSEGELRSFSVYLDDQDSEFINEILKPVLNNEN